MKLKIRRFLNRVPSAIYVNVSYPELKKFYADENYIPDGLNDLQRDFLHAGTVVCIMNYEAKWISEFPESDDVFIDT